MAEPGNEKDPFPLLKLPGELHVHVAEAITNPIEVFHFSHTCRALRHASKACLKKAKQQMWDETDVLAMLKHHNASLSMCCVTVNSMGFGFGAVSGYLKRTGRFTYAATHETVPQTMCFLCFSGSFENVLLSSNMCEPNDLTVSYPCGFGQFSHCHYDTLAVMMRDYVQILRNKTTST